MALAPVEIDKLHSLDVFRCFNRCVLHKLEEVIDKVTLTFTPKAGGDPVVVHLANEATLTTLAEQRPAIGQRHAQVAPGKVGIEGPVDPGIDKAIRGYRQIGKAWFGEAATEC